MTASGIDPGARYVGRFAPSPTGPLHFGSLVAALASCCDARASGGLWRVRIEDVDTPRTIHGAEGEILDALERHGFAWDGEIVRQSARTALYESALECLRASGDAFRCACTRRELEGAPVGAGGERVYPGTCRDGIPRDQRNRTQHAWRLRIPADSASATFEFRDRVQAVQSQDLAREVGDFVVKRADGLFAYQLAVVVDDAAQSITHVVRGADLLASTPRQILLQRRLGLPTPTYLHHAVAVNTAGEKLSKQTHAAPLSGDPLSALIAAWHFLDQPLPTGSSAPASIAEFWKYAATAFDAARLPSVAMLPAPRGLEIEGAGAV